MANIQITGLPSKVTLDDDDFIHVKNTLDGIDYKVPGRIIKDSKYVSFTPGVGLVSTNLQAAIDELAAGANKGGSGYYSKVTAQTTLKIGPGGDFSTIQEAINLFATRRARLSTQSWQLTQPSSETIPPDSRGKSLINLIVLPGYVWGSTVVLNGGEDLSNIHISTSHLDTNTVDTGLVGPLFEISGGTKSPRLSLKVNFSQAAGAAYFLDISGSGSVANLDREIAVYAPNIADPANPLRDGGCVISNTKTTAIQLSQGGALVHLGSQQEAIKFVDCHSGISSDGATVSLPYDKLVFERTPNPMTISGGSIATIGNVVASVGPGSGILVSGGSIAAFQEINLTGFDGIGIEVTDNSTSICTGLAVSDCNINVKVGNVSEFFSYVSVCSGAVQYNVLCENAATVSLNGLPGALMGGSPQIASVAALSSSQVTVVDIDNTLAAGTSFSVGGFSKINLTGSLGSTNITKNTLTLQGIITE